MKKYRNLFLIGAACLIAASGLAAAPELTRNQISQFNAPYFEEKKAACQVQSPSQKEIWLLDELKKLGEIDPKTKNLTRETWNAQLIDFKVDGQETPAFWISGGLGTFGSLAGKEFKFSNDKDGQHLSAPLVSVGKGTLPELSAAGKLDDAFWFVEKSESIPNLSALAIEAKAHRAAGLVVYGNAGSKLLSDQSKILPAALPIFGVSEGAATAIKNKLKKGTLQVTASMKTEFPFNETAKVILLKKGERDPQVLITAWQDDCMGIGESLAMLQWLSAAKVSPQGTTFAFVSSRSFVEDKLLDESGHPAIQLPISAAGESKQDRTKFLNKWFKADQNPDSALDVKPLLKKVAAVSSNLKGLISGEDLKKYNDIVKQAEKNSHARFAQIYDSWFPNSVSNEDVFSELSSELKSLKQVHALAERGQWNQALGALKHISDFQWADNVSMETFLDYEKQKAATGVETVNPEIWVEVQKGRQNVDVLLQVLEAEIDRVDKKLSDNFFKLEKSIQ